MSLPADIYDELVEKWRREPKEIEPAIQAALTIAEQSRLPLVEDELDRERKAHQETTRALQASKTTVVALEDEVAQYRALAEGERAHRRQLEQPEPEPTPEPETPKPLTEQERLAALGWRRG
jgi:hypothetical protein